MTKGSKILFKRHAREKFELAKHYGFKINTKKVTETINKPMRLDQKEAQYFATRAIDSKYALRVVYEKRKDYLLVITFYPVRRERYGI